MTGAELRDALVALYGTWGWQSKAAKDLECDVSSVRRWVKGEVAVPGPVAAAVRCFQREKVGRSD